MKWILMAALAAFVTLNAWAGDAGREAAAKVCGSLYYEADQARCLKIVEAADSFETVAVEVCKTAYYDKDKTACLDACKNKSYLEATLKACAEKYYDKDKIKCLAENGKVAAAKAKLSADEREETILEIERVLGNLRRDEIETATRRLKALRDALEKAGKK